jgi:hypothetical protein
MMFIDHSRVDMRRAGHTHIDCSICNFDLKRDYSLAGFRVLKRLQSCLALRWDLASPNMLTLSLCFGRRMMDVWEWGRRLRLGAKIIYHGSRQLKILDMIEQGLYSEQSQLRNIDTFNANFKTFSLSICLGEDMSLLEGRFWTANKTILCLGAKF